LRFGEFVGVFERVVLGPGDVELVTALLDVGDIKFPKSSGLTGFSAFAQAVGVFAAALLKLGEVLRSERTV
jgi:hypothetical protein